MSDSVSPTHISIPVGGSSVHDAYGLRITHFSRDAVTEAKPYQPRIFAFFSICHFIKGEGKYHSPDGTIHSIRPGQGLIVTPDTAMDYYCTDEEWVEDYLCFSGPIADQLHSSGFIDDGIIFLGNDRRLLTIMNVAQDPSPNSQLKANILLQKLLIDLHDEKSKLQNHLSDPIESLCAEISKEATRWWTVREMAERCHLSGTHFRNKFKSKTGCSPKNYLEQVKMRQAGEEVLAGSMKINAISLKYGYTDICHFSRVFKRIMGYSPIEYRKIVTGSVSKIQ